MRTLIGVKREIAEVPESMPSFEAKVKYEVPGHGAAPILMICIISLRIAIASRKSQYQ